MNLHLKSLTAGVAALLLMSGIFATQALAAAPLARIVVAKSGGNYTTITAALNAITPSATKPYVIEVWPGVYTENVVLKSYVHLKGSGREVTTIQNSTSFGTVITATNLTNVEISGFTINGTGSTTGIRMVNTKATVADSTISNHGSGIAIESNSAATVTGNNVLGNKYEGIMVYGAFATITGNVVSGNGSGAGYDSSGIYCERFGPGFVTSRATDRTRCKASSGSGKW